MQSCYKQTQSKNAIPIYFIKRSDYAAWLKKQKAVLQKWLKNSGFVAKVGAYSVIPNSRGEIDCVILIFNNEAQVTLLGALPLKLPKRDYYIATDLSSELLEQAVVAWGMGAYSFSRYKKTLKPAKLILTKAMNKHYIQHVIDAHQLGRDLINTPAEDMGPAELADAVKNLAAQHQAKYKMIQGKALEADYPAIYTVGRASPRAPRLIELRWGEEKNPSLTLVGKGICFDTGGLDLKPAPAMGLMKKDMGGSAHVLALASLIMSENLPINLRVLVAAADNGIDGSAYRPGDVITMRNGMTVEITNTDAEGRLILADALADAVEEKPDLLINFATLTGAARVALGPEYAVLFTEQAALADELIEIGECLRDPVWRLPLHKSYRRDLRSKIADMMNAATSGYGGAITAALFLQAFVPREINWLHFDIMGWNTYARPSHPEGGELMGVRAVFDYLRNTFVSSLIRED